LTEAYGLPKNPGLQQQVSLLAVPIQDQKKTLHPTHGSGWRTRLFLSIEQHDYRNVALSAWQQTKRYHAQTLTALQ